MRIKLWLAVMIVTFMTLTTVAKIISQPLPEPPAFSGATQFDTREAMRNLNELAQTFPRRDYTDDRRLQAADWIASRFSGMGLQVYTQNFSETIAGKKISGLRNVYAVLPGRNPDAFLVMAHYDTPPYVRQGAADDASGIAVMLELARVFAKEGKQPERTMIFLASGGETYGAMWGSENFIKKSGLGERLAAVLTLDHVNMGAMRGIRLDYAGTQNGYTPIWYRELALRAVNLESKAIDSSLLIEWLERAIPIGPKEPGIYLRSGIPALNLEGIPRRITWQKNRIGTPNDTVDHIWPGTVGKYGRAAERTLRSLLAANELPKGEMTYWKMGDRYIPGWGVTLLQLLFLLPLLAGLIAAWRNMEGVGSSGVGKEFGQWLAIVIAGLAGYFVLWLSAGYGLIKTYELHPAALKDPILHHPAWLPLLLMVIGIALAYYVLQIAMQLQSGRASTVGFALFMTIFLLYMAIAILSGHGFTVVAFMGPAVILWPLIKPSKALSRRIVNSSLSLLSVIVIVFVLIQFARLENIGDFWWYLVMSTTTGLIGLPPFVFILAAIAMIWRVGILTATQPAPYRSEQRFSGGNRTMKF